MKPLKVDGNPVYYKGFKCDDKIITMDSLPDSTGYTTQYFRVYNNKPNLSNNRDMVIEFTSDTYLEQVGLNSNTKTWYINNMKGDSNGNYYNRRENDELNQIYYLAQEDFGGPVRNEVGDFVLRDRIVTWDPNGKDNSTLIFDATGGDIHLYNRNVGFSNNTARCIEFKAGSKLIVPKVTYGDYVNIVVQGVRVGYSDSDLRYFIDNDYLSMFPDGLVNILKLTAVKSNAHGLTSSIKLDYLKMYAPSFNELGGDSTDTLFSEETAASDYLEALVSATNKQLTNYPSTTNIAWWTRSANKTNITYGTYVSRYGEFSAAHVGTTSNYVICIMNI